MLLGLKNLNKFQKIFELFQKNKVGQNDLYLQNLLLLIKYRPITSSKDVTMDYIKQI